MNKTIVTQTKKVTEIRMSKQDLIKFLKTELPPTNKHVDIYMHVPGGGRLVQYKSFYR